MIKKRTSWPLALAFLLPWVVQTPSANGREILIADSTTGPQVVLRIDPDTGAIVAEGDGGSGSIGIGTDFTVDSAGWIYGTRPSTAFGGLTRFRPDLTSLDFGWASVADANQVAVQRSGSLLVLDRVTAPGPDSGIYSVDAASGAAVLMGSVPGLGLVGMDVPRAGPLEDGALVVGFEPPIGEYFLWRFRRQPDGSLTPEGPFGPLNLLSRRDCIVLNNSVGGAVRNLAVRPDGESFLIPEGCTRRIQEFDLDGNFIRTVATIEIDETLTRPGRPDVVQTQFLTNLHVDSRGELWVGALQRAWHLSADGTPIHRIDRVFKGVMGIVDTEWVPFESDRRCEPKSLGYWKRQCLSEGHGRRALSGGRTGGAFRGTAPQLHPDFRPDGAAEILARADSLLSDLDVDACDALWPDSPREPRSLALAKWAAVACNRAAVRVHDRCVTTFEGEATTVGELREQVEQELDLGEDADWRLISRLAARVLTADTPEEDE